MIEGMRPSFLSTEQCLAMTGGYLVTVNVQHIYEARGSRMASQALFGDPGARHCIDGRGAAALFSRVMTDARLPLVQGNVLLREWLDRAGEARLLVIGSTGAVVDKVMAGYPRVISVVDARMVDITSCEDAERWAIDIAARYPGPWDMVAIALGVPKQELLGQALQHRIPAPIYCLGGSFEILADALPRSPRWVQAIGLEGVWRLVLEPSRKRIERLLRTYATFAQLRLRNASLDQLMGRG